MNRLLRFISRLLFSLVMSMVVMSVAGYAFLRTDSGVKLLKEFAESQFAMLFNGRLAIEKAEMDFPFTLSLHNAKLFIEGDSAASVSIEKLSLDIEEIKLGKKLEEGLVKEIRIAQVLLESPKAAILLQKNGQLNLLRLLKIDSTVKADTGAPPKIDFIVNEIAIRNGDFTWQNGSPLPKDSATLAALDSLRLQKVTPVNFDSLHLSAVNLRLKGQLKGDEINVTIQECSLSIPESDMAVQKGELEVSLSPMQAQLHSFSLQTSRSEIVLKAALKEYDFFKPYSESGLKKALFYINLDVKKLSTDDVKRLVPLAYALKSDYELHLAASGSPNTFALQEATVATLNSRVSLSGAIKNAFTPENSELNLALSRSFINLGDVEKLTTMKIPDYSHAGRVDIDANFKGRLNRFRAQFGFDAKFGRGKSDVEINLTKKNTPEYAGGLEFQNLNIGAALNDTTLLSNLNLSAKLEGKGNSLENIEANFTATLNKSRLSKYVFTKATLDAKIAQRKASADFSLTMDRQFVSFSGAIDLSQSAPTYNGEGKIQHFDISTFTGNDSLKTDLTLDYGIQGSGISLGDVSVDFKLELDSSRIGKQLIPKGTKATAALVQNKVDSSGTFVFFSNLLDIEAEGKFDLAQLVNLIQLESAVVGQEIYKDNIFRSDLQNQKLQQVSKKVKKLERNVKKAEPTLAKAQVVLPTVSLNFRISLKTLAGVSSAVQSQYFNAVAEMKGKVSSSPNQCSFTAALNIDSTTYGSLFFAQNLKVIFAFTDDIVNNEHRPRTKFSVEAFRVRTGDQRLLNTKLAARYERQTLQLDIQSTHVNTRGAIELNLLGGVFGTEYIVEVERFKFATADYTWEANENARLQISPKNIRFNNVEFHNREQSILLTGYIEYDGDGALGFSIRNFNLADLRRSLFPDQFEGEFGGRVNLDLDVTGNLQSPKIQSELRLNDIVFSKVKGGNLVLNATYSKKRLNLTLKANTDDLQKSRIFAKNERFNRIQGEGRIPINLEGDKTPIGLIETEDVFLEISSNDIAASALEAFVPLERTTGYFKFDVKVSGSFPKPDIKFNLMIDKVQTTPIATQVEYLLDGSIVGTPNRVQLNSLIMQDQFGGSGSVGGAIEMKNFLVQSLDVRIAFNRMHLMKKPEGKDGLPFGYLIASSRNLRYFGTLEAPRLTGQLTINEGDMSSFAKNANNASQFAEAARFITMRSKEDTTISLEERGRLKKEKELAQEFSVAENRARLQAYQITPYDLMTMDLRVTTARRMTYAIIFNKYLGEQMKVGIEDVDIRVRKRGINLEAFGSANISGGNYTAFTKNFEVKSGGKISWNEEDILNAAIDVTAETRVKADDPNPQQSGRQIDVMLVVKITGTALSPNMAMGYRYNDKDYKMPNTDLAGAEDPNAVLNFALLISAGQWYAPPEGSGSSIGSGTIANAGISAGAGLLSSQLSRVAGTISGVQSVNIGLARDASGGFSGVDLAVAYAVPGTDGKLVVVGSGSIASGDSANARGNANSQKLEYRVSDKIVLEAFRLFGQNNFNLFNAEMTELWGFGVGYRDNFHTWSEFSDRIFRRNKSANEKARESDKPQQQPPEPTATENNSGASQNE